jgi:hypothetical protein
MIRLLIKAASIILGVLWIATVFSGEVRYHGFDNPIINILIGLALIFTPGRALVALIAYFLFIAVMVTCGAIGAALLGCFLGTFGIVVGLILGAAGGVWLVITCKLFDLIAKIIECVD